MTSVQKIRPFLWFDGRAEEAANFYVSVFNGGKIVGISRYGDDEPGEPGGVMTATFEIEGQQFIALNGGPHFTFTPAISFFVSCATQAEVDELWDKLCDGGEASQCGWLKDKFGVSWQIIPTTLMELMSDPDDEKSRRVMQAMLKMSKIDVQALQDAYDGR